MSQYRDNRPLLRETEANYLTETDLLERIRDGSPRYGTFREGHSPQQQQRPPPQIPQQAPTNSEESKNYKLSFLILISFDVTLVIFMSVIYYITANTNDHSVVSFFDVRDIKTAVFDLVMVSIIRFVLDSLFYLLLSWVTRIILFITTLSSTVYVPIKAYFFLEYLNKNSDNSSGAILYIIVLLLLFSAFATPWLIAFFFEFKYLPTQRSKLVITTWYDYRPWLCPWLLYPKPSPTQQSAIIQHTHISATGSRRYLTGSTVTRHQSLDTVFRTPVGSLRGSPTSFLVVEEDLDTIHEEDRRNSSPDLPPAECDQLSSMENRYLQLGNEAVNNLVLLTRSNDGWTMLRDTDGIKCYSLQQETRKIWKSEMMLPVSADRLWTVLYYDVEDTKDWNTGVALNEILQKIDQNTDILYTLCTTIGPISPRDFVVVRKWELIQGVYYDANISTTHVRKPPKRELVRGENGPGGYVVVPMEAQRCKFIWVLNSDLKGWIPQAVLDQTVPSNIVSINKNLRTYMSRLIPNQ